MTNLANSSYSSADSVNINADTNANIARIPALAPVSMVPRRTSRAPLPSALLDTIDYVKINHTVERDGIVYFVLDVYLKRFTSRIPTNLQKEKQRHLKQGSSPSTQASAASVAATSANKKTNATTAHQSQSQSQTHQMQQPRTPDYQLEKRFSDFADLRYHVWVHTQKQSEATCAFSNAFMDFIVHSLAQPRLLVRLATTTGMRKKLLTTFCNEFLRLAASGCDTTTTIGSNSSRRNAVDMHASACEARHAIPILLERFFRKQEGAMQQQ